MILLNHFIPTSTLSRTHTYTVNNSVSSIVHNMAEFYFQLLYCIWGCEAAFYCFSPFVPLGKYCLPSLAAALQIPRRVLPNTGTLRTMLSEMSGVEPVPICLQRICHPRQPKHRSHASHTWLHLYSWLAEIAMWKYLSFVSPQLDLEDAYKGKTCGLCGNYDGIEKNDLILHGKKLNVYIADSIIIFNMIHFFVSCPSPEDFTTAVILHPYNSVDRWRCLSNSSAMCVSCFWKHIQVKCWANLSHHQSLQILLVAIARFKFIIYWQLM